METASVHPAEAYLRDSKNPSSLYVKIEGKRRRLFINRESGAIGIIAPGKKKKGYLFNNWNAIEGILVPHKHEPEDQERKLILKYQRLASKASFTNPWIREILNADISKTLYENHITTGTSIDGKCIRLATLGKYCGEHDIELFKECLKNHTSFKTCRFDFCGYDGTLWCEPRENGDIMAGFSKEYRNCGNGYYFLLVNDDTLIGYDID